MSSTLEAFQSAIQLVSGANLAIFALPKLGQEKMVVEIGRWEKALDAMVLQQSGGFSQEYINARDAFFHLRSRRAALDEGNSFVRQLALVISIIAAGYLLWMSINPNLPADWRTYLVSALGALPALLLYARNGYAQDLIKEFSGKRP